MVTAPLVMRLKGLTVVTIIMAIFVLRAVWGQGLIKPYSPSIVVWSPDGRKIAVSTNNGIVLYTPDLQKIGRLGDYSITVNDLAWNLDSTRLAAAQADYQITIWDVNTGNPVTRLAGDRNQVIKVAWSPDGSKLASSSLDRTIRVYDGRTFALLKTLQYSEPVDDINKDSGIVSALAWRGDGLRLAGADGLFIYIWDTNKFTLLKRIEQHSVTGIGDSLAWTPDGQHLIGAGPGIWDVNTGAATFPMSCSPAGDLVAVLSPDGRSFASAGFDSVRASACITGLNQQDESIGSHYLDFDPTESTPFSMAWRPDGLQLVTAHTNGSLDLWDVSSGRLVGFVPREDATTVVLDGWVRHCVHDEDLAATLTANVENNQIRQYAINLQQQTTDIIEPSCMTSMMLAAQYFSTHPTPTPYSEPPMRALTLTAVCSPDPNQARAWRIVNLNPYNVLFTWRWADKQPRASDTASGVVPAATSTTPGEREFTTPTQAGSNTLIVKYGDLEMTAPSVTTQCAASTTIYNYFRLSSKLQE